MRMNRRTLSLAAAAAILAFLALLSYVIVPKLSQRSVTAYFPAAVGLFPGDSVRILGVDVGRVERIDPEGTRVAVRMRLDRRWDLPADAQAVIVAPTLVTTRFVQLTPAYTGGPALPDGGVIPQERTAMPVEWDVVKDQLTRLTQTLGPRADGTEPATGTLGEFVGNAADSARGNGATLHDTLDKLARTTTALSDGRTDLFSMVRNLSMLVDALSQSHEQIVQFNGHLDSVTQLLGTSETTLGDAVAELDGAVLDIGQFVRDNKQALGATVDGLGAATQALVDKRRDLEQVFHIAPTTLVNLSNIYQPAQNSLTSATVLTNTANPVQFLCGAIAGAGEQGAQEATDLCIHYLGPVLKTLAFNHIPLGTVVGNTVGALPDQIVYSEPGLAEPAGKSTEPAAPTAAPAPPATGGLPGLLLPGLPPLSAPFGTGPR
ncbi:MCE family protein [Nocardia rhizosphaerihabitans]|uniref:Mce family protein Mce3D n=1 Tax=Nocardia rhizosphaerihabitans TaxID=1691570 RepID=A0ABQ2KFF9_9NOCA|nr:MCE family protein [Nocardia rhizosphaerihabitans]GGN80167.1 Mce family protein Mce3D [Nocardia rhizosphaerihabitans]